MGRPWVSGSLDWYPDTLRTSFLIILDRFTTFENLVQNATQSHVPGNWLCNLPNPRLGRFEGGLGPPGSPNGPTLDVGIS